MFDLKGLMVIAFGGIGAFMGMLLIPGFWMFDAMSYAWIGPVGGMVIGGIVGRELER